MAEVMAGDFGRLVFPLGPVDAGKTSLFIALYQRCLAGTPDRYPFKASETLIELERLILPWRAASGGDAAVTWRTNRDGTDTELALHLRLATNQPVEDLFLINGSGEVFTRIVDSGGALEEAPLLARAGVLLVCVDGELLGTRSGTGGLLRSYQTALRVLNEEAALAQQCRVVVALTKADIVASKGTENNWRVFLAGLQDSLGQLGRTVVTVETAARQTQAQVDDGLVALLDALVAPAQPCELPVPAAPAPARQMGRHAGGPL